MKKILILFALVFSIGINTDAQLANWTPFRAGTVFPTNQSGQINGACRITELVFHPTDTNKFYALTPEGGLYTTNDQGDNWTLAPGTKFLISANSSFAVDRTNDQHLILGLGDENYYNNGAGIMQSIDGGATFTATNLFTCVTTDIIQSPTNAMHFVASTSEGIKKSTDGGTTWNDMTATNLEFVHMVKQPGANSQVLYAGTRDFDPVLYKSLDFGSTWNILATGIAPATTDINGGCRIAVTPADPNVVYFETIGGSGRIYKSLNGGTTFTEQDGQGAPYLTNYDITVAADIGQGNYNNALWVDNADASKLWVHAHCTSVSTDNGSSWTLQTQWFNELHTDMHDLRQAPFNNNKLYSCNDGGVWLSTDGGNTWTPKTNGMYAYEVYQNAATGSPTKSDFYSIGTQDNGRIYGDVNGWYTTEGGDDLTWRTADYNGHIYFNGRAGATGFATRRILNHTGVEGPYGTTIAIWNDMAFNRSNKDLGFIGTNNVHRTADLSAATPTWTQISNFNSDIRAMHSCIADANKLYVLLQDGSVYISINALAATPTFTLQATAATSNFTGSIVAMANDANIVYMQGDERVFRSGDGGVNWTDVTFNLPNFDHHSILAEEFGGTTELVFVATNNAVFYKKAGQNAWTNYSTNLPGRKPPTGFTMYDDGTHDSRIRMSTYGTAVWESPFGNLRAIWPLETRISKFEANCQTNSIELNWQGEGDGNTSYFELEKSTDRVNWNRISKIDVKDYNKSEYTFLDTKKDEINYYRLKIVENDTKFVYSKVINLICIDDKNGGISAYPVPFNDILNLSFTDVEQIKIYDVNGRVVYEGSETVINTSTWSSGVYMLKASKQTIKLMKE